MVHILKILIILGSRDTERKKKRQTDRDRFRDRQGVCVCIIFNECLDIVVLRFQT